MRLNRKVRYFALGLPVIVLWTWIAAVPNALASEERAELATRIIELLREEAYLERHVDVALRMVPPDQRASSEEILSRLDLEEIYTGLGEAIEERYTAEELRAYLEFASTDVGRSILRKQAEIDVVMQQLAALAVLKAIAGE